MKSLVFGTAFLLLFLYSCSENNDYTREETLTNETEGSEIDTSRDSLSAENTYATKSAPLFIQNSDSWLKLPLYFSTLEKTRETTRRALTKADKQPIGKHMDSKPFTTHTLELEKGDTLYIFSDGYSDQFGGPKGKKYKSVNFKKFLLSIQEYSMEEQYNLLNEEFENWRGELEQLNDICIIGLRI